MKFLELATKVLSETKKPMSAPEIWEFAERKGYISQLETKGATPLATLGARLYNAANDKRNTRFQSVGVRPKRFYIPGITAEDQLRRADEITEPELPEEREVSYLEKDLHCVLAYFTRTWFDAYPKTIVHSRSKKKDFGEWIHPDMVACSFPSQHWKTEAYELSQMLGDVQLRFYSFEIKQRLSFSNLRESFFQAVSNSSWAHQGFLVAAEIDENPEFFEELTRLSRSFGIGVIKLDLTNPDDTRIKLTAGESDVVEWDMVNKLAAMNKDFRAFLARVRSDLKSEEIREEMYDQILEPEAIIKKFGKHASSSNK